MNDDPFVLPPVPGGVEGGGSGTSGGGSVGGGVTNNASRTRRSPAAPTAQGLAQFPPVRCFTETDEQGHFELTVEQGRHTVVAFAPNYTDQFQDTNVTVGQTATVNFQLEVAPPGDPGDVGILGRNTGPNLQRRR